ALHAIATQRKLGYAQLESVAYLGPPETAARLRTRAALRLDEARALPDSVGNKFLNQRDWSWPELTEPRSLLGTLATEGGVEIVNPTAIPHDLWPAVELPPLRWLDRMTLLAAQFGLTYRFLDDGRKVELVAMPDEVLLTRSYAGGRNARGM